MSAPDIGPVGLSSHEQELLRARAVRAASVAASEEEDTLPVGEFPLGGERYALPLGALRAAIPLKMVTPVPLAPGHVVGIVRFQGQTMAVFSLASLLGGRGLHADPSVLLVVDAGNGHLLALDCEEVPKPTALPLGAVEQARTRARGPVLDVITAAPRPVHLLDVGRLAGLLAGGARDG